MTRQAYAKIIFKNRLGYKPNLKDPQTYCEKINWLKLNYFPHDKLAIQCTDKYLVRKYIEDNGMGEYLNELYGQWDDARKIDFDALPDKFVLKVTHGCDTNIICDDKSKLDIKKTVKQLNKWLKEDYGVYVAEPHYSKLKGKGSVVAEKFLEGDFFDHKFFCYHGEPEYMAAVYIDSTKQNPNASIYYDKSGELSKFIKAGRDALAGYTLTPDFEKMKDLSAKLAKPFPFVRVDWMCVNGKIYFSEMTFTPVAGLSKFDPPEYDRILGGLLDINKCKVK